MGHVVNWVTTYIYITHTFYYCMYTHASRYQHHLTDVTLLENLKRILTNCQLQIKTEVSVLFI